MWLEFRRVLFRSPAPGAPGAFYEPSQALKAQVDKKANWDLSGSAEPAKLGAAAARLRGVGFGIACHLADEKVATLRDIDRGATIGLRWAAGPFAMMNKEGLAKADAEVGAISSKWGKAFPHPASLAQQAKGGAPWPLPAVAVECRRTPTPP